MKCPRCNTQLEEVELEDIKVDFCNSCEGLFYEKNELQSVIQNTIEDNDGALNNYLQVIEKEEELLDSEICCPEDGKSMKTLEYPEGSGIILDLCTECQGIWADNKETEKILTYLIKNDEVAITYTPQRFAKDLPIVRISKRVRSLIRLFRMKAHYSKF